MNMHQFLILCSSKAMMFVKLYFPTSDIYLISLVSLDPSGFPIISSVKFPYVSSKVLLTQRLIEGKVKYRVF